MTARKILSRIGITLACLGILFFVIVYSAAILYFFGYVFARIGFYLPVLGVILYIYIEKKERGYFLEALAFIFTLFLAMVFTSDLLGIV
ncbi:hypothetical protein ACFLUL_00760 [Chloroflexota bacterium]